MEQQIGYCTTADGVRIAYATYGNDEAPPLVFMHAWLSQEAIWGIPEGQRFLQALARAGRLITFDYRGMGASQRDVLPNQPQTDAVDLQAVVDALDFGQLSLFSIDARGAYYASHHPDLVSRLILYAPTATYSPYSKETLAMIKGAWGMYTRAAASVIYPGGSAEELRAISDAARLSASPEWVIASGSARYDFRDDFRRVACPTLILHRTHDQTARFEKGKASASLIRGARFIALNGASHNPMWHHLDYMNILYDFLGVSPQDSLTGRGATAIILFTDIADSTALTERMGDAAFRAASRSLDSALRAAIREAGGRPVEGKVLGDGVMAVFESAAQAIDAARLCVAAATESELRLHIGVHAGDVIREEANVFGGAVNIASRICGLCAAGEILVSQTVRDLARTSAGVEFEDRGEHAMKGVGDPVRVFAIRPTSNI